MGPGRGTRDYSMNQQRQRIIALACSKTTGRSGALGPVRLLGGRSSEAQVVPRVGRETIRVLLETHDSEAVAGKNVVRSDAG